MPAATLEEPPAERPGTVIGPYKLLQQIGEGGSNRFWLPSSGLLLVSRLGMLNGYE